MRRSIPLLVIAGLIASCSVEGSDDALGTAAVRGASLRALGIHVVASPPKDGLLLERARDAASPVRLTDASGAVSITFALEGAHAALGVTRDGVTFFPSAIDGADVAQASLAEGIEDFVFLDTRPAREEITYVVDVSRVAGLRFANGSLEMLDAGGAPRLRVARPWVAAADGTRHDGVLAIDGCVFDTSLAAPWGRPVTPPGASTCRVRVTWSGVPYPLVVDPAWTSTGSLGGSRYGHAMTTLASGKLLVVDGFHNGGSMGVGLSPDGELFDPATHTWAGAGSLANGRQDLAMALMPNGKYLIVGGGGSSIPDFYDPAVGFSRSMTSTTSTASGATATTLVSGLVLYAGGTTGSPQTAATLYTAATDTFSAAGPLGAGRAYHTATMLASGKVLFAGGNGASGPLPSAELYDPVANTFSPTGPMGHPRATHIAVRLTDGRVLVAGGGDPSGEVYDPAAGTFTPAGTMSSDRVSAQAALLQTGHVLVASGSNAGANIATVDIFDPATSSFAAAAPLSVARTQFGAAVLANGDAVVVGGKTLGGISLSSTEIWKPGTGGAACIAKDDCLAGVCQEGVCCSAASCTGACKTCISGTGACAAVVSADDLDSCTGASTCDAAGACKSKNGQTCPSAAACASGFCVDGVCCDKACNGQCEACDVAARPGTCSAVTGNSHGTRARCTSFGTTCGGACNGINGAECAFFSAVTSCGAACADAVFTASTCDGLGACAAAVPQPCSGNFACADATSCKTSCAADADCAKDFHCDGAKCLPTAVCLGSVVKQAGRTVDCAPYTCDQAGACRKTCSVVTECIAPNVCSLGGECVAPSLSADASGCVMGRQRGGDSSWIAIAIALLAACRRKREAA